MWKGVLSRCRDKDVSLVTFRGATLGKEPASILYDLFEPSLFDGFLTWASSDADKATVEYYSRFGGKALVGMTFHVPGHPVVLADSKRGMFDLTKHFIEEHGFKRIAFLRGPESHVYARERLAGYLEALKGHGIEADERLISPPLAWGVADGIKGYDIFMGERGLKPGRDIDAVIAAGDNMALGFLERLAENGYRVPDDVALGGFNDSVEARCANPPLTTVAMPFFKQGEKGVDLLLSQIGGESAEEQYTFAANLVVGRSCGCESQSLKRAAASEAPDSGEDRNRGKGPSRAHDPPQADVEGWRRALAARMVQAIGQSRGRGEASEREIRAEVDELLDAFIGDVSLSTRGAFIKRLDGMLRADSGVASDLDYWQDIISDMRLAGAGCLGGGKPRAAENLWGQARVMIAEASLRASEAQSLDKAKENALLRTIGSRLISSYEVGALMDILADSLGKLGIQCFYVALFDGGTTSARMVLARGDRGRIALGEGGRGFAASEIVPRDLLPQGRRYSLEVEALCFQEKTLGFVAFETGPEDGSVYSTLAEQLSSALYGAMLLAERGAVKAKLEGALSSMGGKADIVSRQSEKIAGGVGGISSTMEEIAASVREISQHLKTVMSTVESAESLVNKSTAAIADLKASSQRIGESVKLINDIAEQTNILALNAAIEAARAGQAGRGFSVVAKEVKALAAQTVSATAQIQDIVGKNNASTAETERVIIETRDSIRKVSGLSTTIAAAVNEQAKATSDISGLLIDATRGASEISAAISEIASLGDSLSAI
jgi:DNA-binding LacI/PurR family transcriptional regulator